MALAGLDQNMTLAKMVVEETGRGVYEDKTAKNLFATEYVYNSIKYEKTVGVMEEPVFDRVKQLRTDNGWYFLSEKKKELLDKQVAFIPKNAQ